MVREEKVHEMVQATIHAMDLVEGGSIAEMLSASYTVTGALMDTVLAHSTPQDKEFNRDSMMVSMKILHMKLNPPSVMN